MVTNFNHWLSNRHMLVTEFVPVISFFNSCPRRGNWSFVSLNERPYLIIRLNLMILFLQSLQLKTADFNNCGWGCHNPQFSAENHGFQSKTADFSFKKPRIMVENRRFWPKTVDFLVSEFKTKELFVSFQSRERIQRVSMFFSFFLFCGVV